MDLSTSEERIQLLKHEKEICKEIDNEDDDLNKDAGERTATIQRSTKAEQFVAKVHGLQDYNQRISEKAVNAPSGHDVATFLKYFQQTLLSWVKENHPCYCPVKKLFKCELFPSVDYALLYDTLLQSLYASGALESGVEEFVKAVLNLFSCLVPFLEDDVLQSVPTTIVSVLPNVPPASHHIVIDFLCSYMIPFFSLHQGLSDDNSSSYFSLSCPAILMMVLQFCPEHAHWMKVIECLMTYRKNVLQDLIMVLASNCPEVLEPGVHLLNRYFPPKDIGAVKAYQASPYDKPPIITCQHPQHPTKKPKTATKVCLDPGICASMTTTTPPFYLCQPCHQLLLKSEGKMYVLHASISQIAGLVSVECEWQHDKPGIRPAAYTCCSAGCTVNTGFRPIRLCSDCHVKLHIESTPQGSNHYWHESLSNIWNLNDPHLTYSVDVIVQLLKQVQPDQKEKFLALGLPTEKIYESNSPSEMDFYKRIFRSFHGVWFVKSLCTIPPSQYHVEYLGRLLAMLLSWTEAVSYTKQSHVLGMLQKVQQQAFTWIKEVLSYDLDLYCSCLLPTLPNYARVGGPYNMLSSKVRQLLEGLNQIYILVTLNLIPEEVWERIMPLWMQELHENVKVDEIKKFKVVLRKLFQSDFGSTAPYALNFVAKRLQSPMMKQRQEGLVYIQILCALDISLNVNLLLNMFIEATLVEDADQSGATMPMFSFPSKVTLENMSFSPAHDTKNMLSPVASSSLPDLESVNDTISYYILMLDILISQISISLGNTKEPMKEEEATSLKHLLISMLEERWNGSHVDHATAKCYHCQIMNIFFYQLSILINLAINEDKSHEMSRRQSENLSAGLETALVPLEAIQEDPNMHLQYMLDSQGRRTVSVPNPLKFSGSRGSSSQGGDSPTNDSPTDGNSSKSSPVSSASTSRKSSLVDIMTWKERISRFVEAKKRGGSIHVSNVSGWSMILNAFPEIQLMEELLKEIPQQHDAMVLQHIVTSLSILCIRGKYLDFVAQEDPDVLERLQGVFFIPSLWSMLRTCESFLASSVVPLLFACVKLGKGSNLLHKEVNEAFDDEDWKKRSAAVERVFLICQFIPLKSLDVQNDSSILVYCYSYLVLATEDIHDAVSARARTMLQSIKQRPLKYIFLCLEIGFDERQNDRSLLLRTLQICHRLIPDKSPFCGTFFLRILKTLSIKSQVLNQMRARGHLQRSQDTFPVLNSNASVDELGKSGDKEDLDSTLSNERTKSCSMPRQSDDEIKTSRLRTHSLPQYRHARSVDAGASFSSLSTANPFGTGPTSSLPRKRKPGTSQTTSNNLSAEAPFLGQSMDTLLSSVKESSPSANESKTSLESREDGQEIINTVINLLFMYLSDKTRVDAFTPFGQTTTGQLQLLAEQLGVFLGYTGEFISSPNAVRENPVFSAFITGMSNLLDLNPKWAIQFLPLHLDLLLYCVKERQDDDMLIDTIAIHPTVMQIEWLINVLLFLYKYPFKRYHHETLQLIGIVMNSIESHNHHTCSGASLDSVYIKELSKKSSKRKAKHGVRTTNAPDSTKLSRKLDLDVKALSTSRLDLSADLSDPGSINKTKQSSSTSSRYTVLAGNLLGTDPSGTASSATAKFDISRIFSSPFGPADTLFNGLVQKCPKCFLRLATFSDSALNLCIIVLSTFVHRDPDLSAPFVIDMLTIIGRKARYENYPWEVKGAPPVIGSPTRVAQNFFRCILVQLAPNNIFSEIFRADIKDSHFFPTLAASLVDFADLNETAPIVAVMQDFVSRNDASDRVLQLLKHLVIYLNSMQKQNRVFWEAQVHYLEPFFKRLTTVLPAGIYLDCALEFIAVILCKAKNIFKSLLPHFTQLIVHVMRNATFKVDSLVLITTSSSEAFTKERDRLTISKCILAELLLLIKSKTTANERNVKQILHFFCQSMRTSFSFEKSLDHASITQLPSAGPIPRSNPGTEAFKLQLTDTIDLLRTWNFKAKDTKEKEAHAFDLLDQDFPTLVKGVLGQLVAVALEQDGKESRGYLRVTACLHTQPVAQQLGRTDPVLESLSNLRTQSWILLGAINHKVITKGDIIHCFSITESGSMMDYIKSIVPFVFDDEEGKWHKRMFSWISHIFILSQIWTAYLECHIQSTNNEIPPIASALEYWTTLTKLILSTIQKFKAVSDDIIILFASVVSSMMSACPMTFTRLYPLWEPLFTLNANKIPVDILLYIRGGVQVVDDTEGLACNVSQEWIRNMWKQLTKLTQGQSKFDPVLIV